jgi:hypothetical protein
MKLATPVQRKHSQIAILPQEGARLESLRVAIAEPFPRKEIPEQHVGWSV